MNRVACSLWINKWWFPWGCLKSRGIRLGPLSSISSHIYRWLAQQTMWSRKRHIWGHKPLRHHAVFSSTSSSVEKRCKNQDRCNRKDDKSEIEYWSNNQLYTVYLRNKLINLLFSTCIMNNLLLFISFDTTFRTA